MTEEVAKIKANKDGIYIDIVPEKCVSAQKAQYDENGRDLLDAESSQTIKGANTFAAKQTFTGGVAVSGTSAIAGNVNMDSGDLAIGAKVTASNTGNSIKVANHDAVLTSNDVLSTKDINTPNGDANNLLHRSGDEAVIGKKEFEHIVTPFYGVVNSFYPKKVIHKLFEIKTLETYIDLVIQSSLGAEVRVVAYGHAGGATIKTCYATDTIDVTLSIGVDENGCLGVYFYHPTSTRNWCMICSTHDRYSMPVEVVPVNVQVTELPSIVSSVSI